MPGGLIRAISIAALAVVMFWGQVGPISAQTIDDVFRAILFGPGTTPGRVQGPAAPVQAQRAPSSETSRTQELLNRLGYDAGRVDGSFGPRTREAMNAFQRDYGFPVTQTIDQATLIGLDSAVRGTITVLAPQPPVVPPSVEETGAETVAQTDAEIFAPPTNELEGLSLPADGIKPWAMSEIAGLPTLDGQQVTDIIGLLLADNSPGYFENNTCALAQRFLVREYLEQVAASNGCGTGGQLLWVGQDEFARADARQIFETEYAPKLLGLAPELPFVFAVVDDVRLGEYDTGTLSFPLSPYSSAMLEAILGATPGSGLRVDATIASTTPMPPQVLPTESVDAARQLINEINSWIYVQGPNAPQQTGQRMVKRVSVIEIVAIDGETRRVDVRLDSVVLYNLDLDAVLYTFPVADAVSSVVAEGSGGALQLPGPVALDPLYSLLRLIDVRSGEVPEQSWELLLGEVQLRDRAYYDLQQSAPGSMPDLADNDARRPFFGRGDYSLTESRVPLFRQWAVQYAAALPDTVEQTRSYMLYEYDPSRTYEFGAAAGSPTGAIPAPVLAELGLQPDQVIAVPSVSDALVVLPNRADLFTLSLSGVELQPQSGKQMIWRTLLRNNGAANVVQLEDRFITLIPLDPVSVTLEVEGVAVASRSFEDVPRLDGGFLNQQDAALTTQAMLGDEVPLRADVINLLVASALDPADPNLAKLAIQRWHLEQAGEAVGGALYVSGKRVPSEAEALEMGEAFSAWAKERVGALPREFVFSANLNAREVAAGVGMPWSNLECFNRAVDQSTGFAIAGNVGHFNVETNRRVQALAGQAGYGSWTPEDELRITALAIEPLAAHFVTYVECDAAFNSPLRLPVPVYAELPALLPTAPETASSAQVRLAVSEIATVGERPDYRLLLPESVLTFLVSDWQPEAGTFIRIKADVVEVVYLDASGNEVGRTAPPQDQTLAGLLAGFDARVEDASAGTPEGPYGYDILGIQIGMSFEEAEAIINEHMEVGQVLTGMRAFDGSLESGLIRPATSGKLFISADGSEYIGLIDEAPAVEGRVLGAWRRVYLAPNQVPVGDAIAALEARYGDLSPRPITEGMRNMWHTPLGNSCHTYYQYGGQRPALSASWTPDGEQTAIMQPDGQPVPDAIWPSPMVYAVEGGYEQGLGCGPIVTAEIIFDASRMVSAGYPTQGRDWIEVIITDVGPYVEAFMANREALRSTGAAGKEGEPVQPAIRF